MDGKPSLMTFREVTTLFHEVRLLIYKSARNLFLSLNNAMTLYLFIFLIILLHIAIFLMIHTTYNHSGMIYLIDYW